MTKGPQSHFVYHNFTMYEVINWFAGINLQITTYTIPYVKDHQMCYNRRWFACINSHYLSVNYRVSCVFSLDQKHTLQSQLLLYYINFLQLSSEISTWFLFFIVSTKCLIQIFKNQYIHLFKKWNIRIPTSMWNK